MLLLVFGAFIAGALTVLAPCVLPLLPIIIGGSITGEQKSIKRPLYITASLAISLFTFTLLLKATTLLVDIPPDSINYISGGIIIALGLLTLFPGVYASLLAKLGIETKALRLLSKGTKKKDSMLGAIITGAALGPVFSSCSPVYGYILATVLPVNFGIAMIYIVAYILGLAAVLLLIGYYGQQFIGRISWMSDPKGIFQRVVAILFIAVGLLLITGNALRFQTWVSRNTPFNFDGLSAQLIPSADRDYKEGELLNVEPYDAPEEFVGLENWINSEPLKLSEQRGKVVLVDFWTYSCINCIRNNPFIEGWHQQYEDDGLVVVGVHAPEFAFERKVENVQKAVNDQNITYPVALDNDFQTWSAFQNQFWPAYYLIDADGQIRRIHEGEGEYRESEQAIRQLLADAGADLSDDEYTVDGAADDVDYITEQQTAETYLGTKRASNFASPEALGSSPDRFSYPENLDSNRWALSGEWEVGSELITAQQNAKLRFTVNAKEVYLVAQSDNGGTLQVKINGEVVSAEAGSDVNDGIVQVGEARLYRLVNFDSFTTDALLELEVEPGVALNVFTFGS